MFTWGMQLIFWVKTMCSIGADLLCLSDLGLFKDFRKWRREREYSLLFLKKCLRCTGYVIMWFGLDWQVSIESCYTISNHAFSGSTIEQQQYVVLTPNARSCQRLFWAQDYTPSTCTHQLSLLSEWIPKYLYDPTCLIVWWLNYKQVCAGWFGIKFFFWFLREVHVNVAMGKQ